MTIRAHPWLKYFFRTPEASEVLLTRDVLLTETITEWYDLLNVFVEIFHRFKCGAESPDRITTLTIEARVANRAYVVAPLTTLKPLYVTITRNSISYA